jgi:tetratricopeptide (TPR) repeat protein
MQKYLNTGPENCYPDLPGKKIRFLSSALLLFTFFFFISPESRASYAFSSNCQAAYRSAWSLKPDDVQNRLAQEQIRNPKNLIPQYLGSLSDFVNAFSTESKADYQKFIDKKSGRLDLLETEDGNPWYRYCKAEIYLQSAVLKVKVTDYAGAAYDFNKAYRQLSACAEDYPSFLPAQKDLLLLKAVVGTVPDNYKWAAKILGFSGDLKLSMARYEVLLGQMEKSKDFSIFAHESRIIYAFLTFHLLNKPDEAWKQMDAATKDYATNPIDAFVRGNLALHLKKNETAIQTFTPQVAQQPAIPYLDYMMGVAKLQRGDRNAAFYFSRYIKTYKGTHYIKDAYLKLGWAFLLAGDMVHFKSAMELVPKYGSTQLEEDKNAEKEAADSKYTVPQILRARLFFDGGYMDKALAEIKQVEPSRLAVDFQKGEYYYRYGRILDGMNRDNEAIASYQVVIDKYSGLNNFFAPASCLYAGQIWEKNKNKAKAAVCYTKCLSYHGYVYKDSFDQKANAGLKRVE